MDGMPTGLLGLWGMVVGHDPPMPDHWYLISGWDDVTMTFNLAALSVPVHDETWDQRMLYCVFAGAR